ncbi:hypothetical protein LWI28_014023 [Acer negundo]|uniref:Uncharacterized protein n=1 Tax=Acer negundo TaxID=4023 RepID=A0AAD5ILQ7_ACENE|nr:hypothetical protein LWI28_014023 [Acer negundo]
MGKNEKVELNTCFNIKTEEEPIETNAAPFELDNKLEEFIQVFGEEVRLLKEEKKGRTKVDIVKEDEIVVEKDINLIIRIDALEKERDEALKVGEELTRIVVSQEKEFNKRIRKVLMEVEKKDKKYQALKEDLLRKENAFKTSKVKECNLIVELDQAKCLIEVLTKGPTKNEEVSSSKLTKKSHKRPHPKKKKGEMEEFIGEGMSDFEQLGWLMDHATMEIGTKEEPEDDVINMLVWANSESHMEEESE